MLTIGPFLDRILTYIVNPLVVLLVAVSAIYFIYGVFMFMSSDYADKTRKEAQDAIIWGIVGMVVMFSVFGLVRFVLVTFGIDKTDIKSTEAQGYLKL